MKEPVESTGSQAEPGLSSLLARIKNHNEFQSAAASARQSVITALGRLGAAADSAVPDLLAAYRALPDDAEVIAQALKQICRDSKTAPVELVKVLATDDLRIRDLADDLLTEAACLKNAAADLRAILNDPNSPVRDKAACHLQEVGSDDRQLVSVLIELLDEAEPSWETQAVLKSAWLYSLPELVRLICDPSRSPRSKLRAAAIILEINCIKRIKHLTDRSFRTVDRADQRLLEAALEGTDSWTRYCAACSLSGSDSRHPKIYGTLIDGLQASQAELRCCCLKALGRRRNEPEQVDANVTARLIELLEDPDPEVVSAAGAVLSQLHFSAADWIALIGLLEQRALSYRVLSLLREQEEVPVVAVTPLIHILCHGGLEGEQVRLLIAILVKAGRPALEAMRSVILDSSLPGNVRAAVLRGAVKIAPAEPEVISLLSGLLESDDPELRMSAAIEIADKMDDSQPLIPLLVAGLQSEDYSMKHSALEALKKIVARSPAVLASVIPHVNDVPREQRLMLTFSFYHQNQQHPELRRALWSLLHEMNQGEDERLTRSIVLRELICVEPESFLLALLTDTDADLVQETLVVLDASGLSLSDPLRDQLEQFLSGANQKTRLLAALILFKADSRNDTLRIILSEILTGDNRELFQVAIDGLEKVPALDTKWAPLLIDLLQKQEARFLAIRQLGTLGAAAEPAIPTLVEYLDSTSYFKVCAEALQQLGQLAAPAIPVLRAHLQKKGSLREACEALACIEEDHRPTLAILTQNLEQPDLRSRTCLGLACFAEALPTEVESLLLEVFQSNVEYDRSGAIRGLGSLKTKTAWQRLVQVLETENPSLWPMAASALGEIGREPEITVPLLIKVLNSESWQARQSAAHALGQFGAAAQSAVPYLMTTLNDARHFSAAAGALSAIGEPAIAAIPCLVEMLDNGEYRCEVLRVLTRFGPLAKAALPRLKELEANVSRCDLPKIRVVIEAIEAPDSNL
ncbi:MAG: HEAT repeat domain-containing protein [Gimesia chilikensis]|uniref:HEAT repeat domain-containing protein n=1 Tax=Gimesia chilikensis TaxID=2605989 RepID=UPI0037897F73